MESETKAKKIRVLVNEHDPSHLLDAALHARNYRNLELTFVDNMVDADRELRKGNHDITILNVLFPFEKGDDALYYAGTFLHPVAKSLGIPSFYLSAGNYHGRDHAPVVHQVLYTKNTDRGTLNTPFLIDSFPDDQNGEADYKYWEAAYDAAILNVRARSIDKKIRDGAKPFLGPRINEGRFHGLLKRVLDESKSYEDLKELGKNSFDRKKEGTRKGLEWMRKTIREYKVGERSV